MGERRIVVKQTSSDGKAYTDIAVTNLYVSTAGQFMTEGQLIWHRFSAMLVANSIIFVLMGKALERAIDGRPWTRDASLVLLAGGVFGTVLSCAWLNITLRSLRLQRYWRECALWFDWEGLPNPTRHAYERWRTEKGKGAGSYGVLGKPAIFVISMFIVAHLIVALYGLYRAWGTAVE